MPIPAPHLDDLAAAVLDGTPVHWPSVESSADAESRALLKELEVVAGEVELPTTRGTGSLRGRIEVYDWRSLRPAPSTSPDPDGRG